VMITARTRNGTVSINLPTCALDAGKGAFPQAPVRATGWADCSSKRRSSMSQPTTTKELLRS
jgi:hypothetical protein